MNINIYLEDKLAQQLAECAQSIGQSKNSIVRDALKKWINSYHSKQWPSDIIQFVGEPNFLNLEHHRTILAHPAEDPLS